MFQQSNLQIGRGQSAQLVAADVLSSLGRRDQGGCWQPVVRVGPAVSLLGQILNNQIQQTPSHHVILVWSSYPVDCLKQLDVHRVSGEVALDLDEGVAGGHGLDQETVRGKVGGVGDVLLELSVPGLADPGQVQVALSQCPSLQHELCRPRCPRCPHCAGGGEQARPCSLTQRGCEILFSDHPKLIEQASTAGKDRETHQEVPLETD